MKKIGMGLVGPGFIASHHIDAVRRLGIVDVVAIAGSGAAGAARKAEELHVERSYGNYQELIDDPDIDVVHNTTPNHLHFPVSSAAIAAGKHIISDKPLAMNVGESLALRNMALAARVAHVVTYNYRGNPLVQQARAMVAKDDIGRIAFVHGHYFQDWMTDPNVYSWRSDPLKGGASSALGDIGSHWCDLAEHVTDAKITAVLADLTTVVPVRYSAGASAEAFSSGAPGSRAMQITSEDLASVLLRFDNGAKGCFSVGQVLPGHNNDLQLELNGRTASLKWRQERQNELWIGHNGAANAVMDKDPALLAPPARGYAHLPAGHHEAWADAFRNVIADAYAWIAAGAAPGKKPPATATFEDGYRTQCVIDAMLRSHAAGGVWTGVEYERATESAAP